MNVASLERCKELHKLSGWKDTDYTYYANAGQHSGAVWHRSQVFDKPENLPAYDLGYLLRKLPRHIEKDGGKYWLRSLSPFTDDWRYDSFDQLHQIRLRLTEDENESVIAVADTPEDAATKLAIELFKQGVLQREAA